MLGLCHQLLLPSMALVIGWRRLALFASQTPHWICSATRCCTCSTRRQNCSALRSPHVALAVISACDARLNVLERSTSLFVSINRSIYFHYTPSYWCGLKNNSTEWRVTCTCTATPIVQRSGVPLPTPAHDKQLTQPQLTFRGIFGIHLIFWNISHFPPKCMLYYTDG